MLSISTDIRVIFWIVAAVAGGLSAIIGNVLAINVVYFFSKRGRPPTKRPVHIWIIFFISLAISIIFGALAAFAPALPDVTSAPLSSSNNIRLIPTDAQNIVVKLGSQPLSPDDIVPLGETITVIFKILNNGTSPVTIKALVIGSRGPGVSCENTNIEKWSAPDNPFPTPANITIQPGQEYEYRGSRAFYMPGKYFLEPIIQGPNGNWGGIQPFSCISITVDKTKSSQTEIILTPASTLALTPTPSLTPPPSTTTIFEDAFIDNRNNWYIDSVFPHISAGKYTYKVICPTEYASFYCGTYAKIPFIFPKNFRLEIDATVLESSLDAKVGIGFQVRRNETDYYYINYFITDGFYILKSVYNTNDLEIIPKTPTDLITKELRSTNRFGVEIQDSTFTPIINGYRLSQGEDGNLRNPGGSYLIIYISRGHSAILQFDNIVVQEVR